LLGSNLKLTDGYNFVFSWLD